MARSLCSLDGRWLVRCAHFMAYGKTGEKAKWENGRRKASRRMDERVMGQRGEKGNRGGADREAKQPQSHLLFKRNLFMTPALYG
jgi:hypothetical protein